MLDWGIEPGTARTRSQHYTTRLSRRRLTMNWLRVNIFRYHIIVSNKHTHKQFNNTLILFVPLFKSLVNCGDFASDEQFQRLSKNWCWHASIPWVEAIDTVPMRSRYCWQILTCSVESPNERLQSFELDHDFCWPLYNALKAEMYTPNVETVRHLP